MDVQEEESIFMKQTWLEYHALIYAIFLARFNISSHESIPSSKEIVKELIQLPYGTDPNVHITYDDFQDALNNSALRKAINRKYQIKFASTRPGSGPERKYLYRINSYFYKSIERAIASEKIADRVNNLRACLRITIYAMVPRGLFVLHKLIFLAQLAFNLMKRGNLGEENLLNESHFQFLVRGPRKEGDENRLNWLSKSAWESCLALSDIEEFNKFASDLVEAAPRFREWFNHITPETEKLPLDWAALDRLPFQKMLVVRCLRPDRIATALTHLMHQYHHAGRRIIYGL
jgi:hypothetical protein